MPLSESEKQSLDQMVNADALAYLADRNDGSFSGAIDIIAEVSDFGQIASAVKFCADRLDAAKPAATEFPPGVNGSAILSVIDVIKSSASALDALIPSDPSK